MNGKRSLAVVMAMVAGVVFCAAAQANPNLLAYDGFSVVANRPDNVDDTHYTDATSIRTQGPTRKGFVGTWAQWWGNDYDMQTNDLGYTGWSSSGSGSVAGG